MKGYYHSFFLHLSDIRNIDVSDNGGGQEAWSWSWWYLSLIIPVDKTLWSFPCNSSSVSPCLLSDAGQADVYSG